MGPTILIVEDNPDISVLFCTIFAHAGMNVLTAHTVSEARALLEKFPGLPIDAMLVDLHLPDGCGHDLISLVNSTQLPRLRILLSGYDSDSKRYPGFDYYMSKPIDCGKLVTMIRSHLGGQAA